MNVLTESVVRLGCVLNGVVQAVSTFCLFIGCRGTPIRVRGGVLDRKIEGGRLNARSAAHLACSECIVSSKCAADRAFSVAGSKSVGTLNARRTAHLELNQMCVYFFRIFSYFFRFFLTKGRACVRGNEVFACELAKPAC